MAEYQFGVVERLTCLTHVSVKGAKDEPLCLAHKISTRYFVAGAWVHDDGYVLRVEAQPGQYYPLPAERVGKLQEAGLLPSPLPPYTLSALDYVTGYSLWMVLALIACSLALRPTLRRRRLARRMEIESATPLAIGSPSLQTKTDRFVDAQVRPLLRAGEVVQHQAYTSDRPIGGSMIDAAMAHGFYVALTDQRLFFFKARIGAFGPLLENLGTETLDRGQVVEAEVDGTLVTLRLADGSARPIYLFSTDKLSNQDAFLRDVPRLLRPPPPDVAPAMVG